jgi:hypothetical protein
MGGICSTHRRNEELLDFFIGEPQLLRNRGVVRRIILIRNLEKHVEVLTGLKWGRREAQIVDFYENG